MATPVVERTCPVCGEAGAVEFLRKGGHCLVECRACAMIYANPVDASLVSGAFYDELGPGFYLGPDKLAADYAPVRFAREVRLLRRFCPRGNLLDVGCSNGAFLSQVKHRFPADYQILGVDVAGAALDYAAAQGVPVRRGSFPEMDFEGETFSAITFWATLEHIAEPGPFLSKAATILKPGGHCFILVPNFRSLAVCLLGTKYRYILPQHVNYFSVATLRRFAAREPSLEIVHLGSTHFNPLVLWQDWRNRTPASEADRVQLLKRTTAFKRSPWLRPAGFGLAMAERLLGGLLWADNLVLVLRRRERSQ